MCVCVFISLESRAHICVFRDNPSRKSNASVSRGTHSIGISPKVLFASVPSRLYLLV